MSGVQLPAASFQVTKDQDIFKVEETQAKNNRLIKKIGRVAWLIFSIIVFPVGIGRFFVWAVKKIAPHAILPAADMFNLQNAQKNASRMGEDGSKARAVLKLDLDRETFLANSANGAKQVTLETADHTKLDAVTIMRPEKPDTGIDEQKWIVFMNPNGMSMEESLEYLKTISDETRANVLSGNYRGVMRSEGKVTSSQDLVMDGETMVQYLLAQGVPSENILVHGWSLGGAVAAEVVALHQEEGHEMHLCHDRSFTTIKDFLGARIPRLFAWIVGGLAKHAGWKFDGIKAYKKTNGQKFIIYSKEDGVVRYKASLYKRLKETQKTKDDRKRRAERVKLKKKGDSIFPYPMDYKPANRIKIHASLHRCDPHVETLRPNTRYMREYVQHVRTALQMV